jgi:hypothetical protein
MEPSSGALHKPDVKGKVSRQGHEKRHPEALFRGGDCRIHPPDNRSQYGAVQGFRLCENDTDSEAKEAITTLHGALLINGVIMVGEARPQKQKGQQPGVIRENPARMIVPGAGGNNPAAYWLGGVHPVFPD